MVPAGARFARFVGVQYHLGLKSKPFEPYPLFAGFIAAAVRQARLI